MNRFVRKSALYALFVMLPLFPLTATSTPHQELAIGFGGDASLLIYLPVTLAHQLGYFADEGLHVTMVPFQGGNEAKEAVLTGQVDVAASYYSNVVLAAARGDNLMSFMTLLRYPGWALVISPQSETTIEAVEDLARATIGVSSIDSGTHSFARYLLSQAGVPIGNNITFDAIGTTAGAVEAVLQGTVDAAVLYEPTITQVTHQAPGTYILVDSRTSSDVSSLFQAQTLPGSVLYTSSKWLADNPDLARSLTRAIQRTLKWIQEHTPAEIAQEMGPWYGDVDPSLYEEALQNMYEMFSPDGRLTPDGANAVKELLAASYTEFSEVQFDLSGTYSNEFLSQSLLDPVQILKD